MSLEKVGAGQRFKPLASDWNAFVDAARYVQDQNFGQGAGDQDARADTVPMRNVSGLDVPRYALLWRTAADYADPLVSVTRPGHPHLEKLCIAAAPIAAGDVGPVWTSGVHPLRIEAWDALADAMFPFHAISQTDSFLARRHLGNAAIRVLAKHETSPLVYAELLAA